MTPIDEVNVRTAFDLIGRKREGRPAPMACCPRCVANVPLVSTIEFPGAEFYCLECGATVGFLSPRPVESSDDLSDLQHRLQERFEAGERFGQQS